MHLSNESSLSCRDAGIPPPRIWGFRGTGGSTGLSEPDECCCFSISPLYELRLERCDCLLASSSPRAEFLCLGFVRVQKSVVVSQLPALMLLARWQIAFLFIYVKEAAMTKPPSRQNPHLERKHNGLHIQIPKIKY